VFAEVYTMHRLLDLSRPIEAGMPVFPVYPSVQVIPWTMFETHGFRSEVLFASTHTGTHVDAPLHFVDGGLDVSSLRLEAFVVEAVAVDVSGRRLIGGEVGEKLKGLFNRGMGVLLYTGWEGLYGSDRYFSENPGLTVEGARVLVELGVSTVGIDCPSIDPAGVEGFPAHRALLSSGIPVIENLRNLKQLVGKRFRLIALPLRIKGATASPVRAVAVLEESKT